VFTDCDGANVGDDKENFKMVYGTAVHEMLHGLGLGHAWFEKGDLMCSSDEDEYGNAVGDTCAGGLDNYDDIAEPTEFDIRALIHAYMSNGFQVPNRHVDTSSKYYCELPCTQIIPSNGFGNNEFNVTGYPVDTNNKETTNNQQSNSVESKLSEKVSTESVPRKYTFISSWGTSGSKDGQFQGSADVAVNNSDNAVYVTDINNGRIQKFSKDGHFIVSLGQKGNASGKFEQPGDIMVYRNFVYVSDIGNNRIQKFDGNGKFILEWGTYGGMNGAFDHPGAISLDPTNERLYITDIGNNRIEEFGTDGTYWNTWGEYGKENGQLDRPTGVAFHSKSNRVYVVDTNNNRVEVFEKGGKFVSKWGSLGGNDGQFNRPTDITIDNRNNLIYVADSKNFRIQVFDENGNFLTKFGEKGEGNGQFLEPTGVAVNPRDGQVYVADKKANKISIFSPKMENNNLTTNVSEDTKSKNSYQLIVYLDDASPQNAIGDDFNIVVYNTKNQTVLSAKPNIDFNDNHQKISPRNGYPIIDKTGQQPKDIRVCAQQEYTSNGKNYLHEDCYPIKQNIQKTYWYSIFDYGEIDGFEGND
jgi:DNA-binding beta-propeller fold protein YncE